MSKPMTSLIGERAKLVAHRFSSATDGVAAVEFGLLVPLLFIMFIGTLEIGQAVGLDRRVSMATASTADLIARDTTMDNTKLDGIMQITRTLLQPYDSSKLGLTVVSVRADIGNAANTKVDWSYSYNSSAPAPGTCSPYSMPAGLLAAGTSAIIVEGRYDYEPILVSHFLNSNVTLQDKATVSPRGASVDYTNGSGVVVKCP